MAPNANGMNGTNGHAHTFANSTVATSINGLATPPLTPIHPGVRDGVAGLTALLDGAQTHLDCINAVKDMKSPTIDGLHEEIKLLSGELSDTKTSLDRQLEDIKMGVEHRLKIDIAGELSGQINSQITREIQVQVKAEVDNWGTGCSLAKELESMLDNNAVLLKSANTKLSNSRSRRDNSTFDALYNFDDRLGVILNSEDNESDLYPETLRHLFLYGDAQVEKLLEFYELRNCKNKIDNLNRFLAFIGLRTVIPGQATVEETTEIGAGAGAGAKAERIKLEKEAADEDEKKKAVKREKKKEVENREKANRKDEKAQEKKVGSSKKPDETTPSIKNQQQPGDNLQSDPSQNQRSSQTPNFRPTGSTSNPTGQSGGATERGATSSGLHEGADNDPVHTGGKSLWDSISSRIR